MCVFACSSVHVCESLSLFFSASHSLSDASTLSHILTTFAQTQECVFVRVCVSLSFSLSLFAPPCLSLSLSASLSLRCINIVAHRDDVRSQQDVAMTLAPFLGVLHFNNVLQCGAVWCSVVQCGAVCCGVLQCVAVCCSV